MPKTLDDIIREDVAAEDEYYDPHGLSLEDLTPTLPWEIKLSEESKERRRKFKEETDKAWKAFFDWIDEQEAIYNEQKRKEKERWG